MFIQKGRGLLIVKELQIPLKIRSLQALLRRLPANYPKRMQIEDDLAKSMAGYKGELSMQYYLEAFTTNKYLFFFNLRLPTINKNHFFQLDLLLITPYYFALFESKNMQGTLTFDHLSHQLIQTIEHGEIGYSDPFQQVFRQQKRFQEWLSSNKTPTIPLHSKIVITNLQSIIKFHPAHVPTTLRNKVIKVDFLENKILSLDKKYSNEFLTKKDMNKLKRFLLKEHTPYLPDYLNRYGIPESILKKGVQCPSCHTIPMNDKYGYWECSSCLSTSKNAHLAALEDYVLLLRSTITNKQLRDFLLIKSESKAKYILHSMDLDYVGTTRGRIYTLPKMTD